MISKSELITGLCSLLPFMRDVKLQADLIRVCDNSKVTDHHAILPTAEFLKAGFASLADSETKLMTLVCAKLLCAGQPQAHLHKDRFRHRLQVCFRGITTEQPPPTTATYHDRKSRKGFLFFCAKKRANFPALSKSFLKKFPKTLPYLHFSA